MYTKGFLTCFAVIVLMSCRAQKEEERNIGPFTKIETRGAVEVVYSHSDTLSLKVEGSAGDVANTETIVHNGVLTISSKGEMGESARVFVSHNGLQALDVQGACHFKGDGVKSDEFEVTVSGAAEVRIRLETGNLKCVQSGASNLHLGGKCEQLKVRLSGASSLKSYDLEAQDVQVESSGAASAKVLARKRFTGNASGASSIRLRGEPTDVTAETSSAASISRVKDNTEAERNKDTLTYHWKKKKLIIVDADSDNEPAPRTRKKFKGSRHMSSKFKHWRGLALGVNGYLGPQRTMDMAPAENYMELDYSRSFNLQLNVIERHFNIVRNHVKLVTGLGIDWHRYEFLRSTTLTDDGSKTVGTLDSSNTIYSKNRLRTTYLQVPLLLEFNTSNNPRKTFHVAFGVVGQYLVGRSTKQVYNDGASSYRINRSNHHLAPFAAKAHVNFGYRGWTLFAEYSLTSLFQPSKGPEVYPIAAGIRVIPFS